MTPSECPRYPACNAPICPLDPQHLRSAHLSGESVCLYLREGVKPGGNDLLALLLPANVAKKVSESLPGIMSTHGAIRRVLEQAKFTGSKIRQGQNIRGVMR